jgi:RND family efflux transporter MFP subunit
VGSAVDGRVISFPVGNGDLVAAGDTLAQLRTETLEWQRAAAAAELTVREQELADLKKGSDLEQIANLEALMKAAAAQRDYAKSQLERSQSLYARGQVVTQYQLDEAQSQVASTVQQYIAANALYDLAVRGPRQEKIAQAEARCVVQQAVVSELEEQIARHTVVAPFEGFVVMEHTEVGQWAASGDPIAEVVQLSEVDVRVNVLEGQVALLRIGLPVTVEVPAAKQRQWQGTVHRIIPQADLRSRTFPVDIRIANRIEEGVPVLMAGYLASAQLPVGRPRQTLAVPKDALVLGGEEPVVFVVDSGVQGGDVGVVRAVPVTLGQSVGMYIEAQGDLANNALVVVEGNERLRTGERVRILEHIAYE